MERVNSGSIQQNKDSDSQYFNSKEKGSDSSQDQKRKQKVGSVYLVGAGPGDRRLISLRGYELLQQADIVFYDRLIDPSLPLLYSSQAEKVYVGKKPGAHRSTQEEINQCLYRAALEGNTVVRLKGGDPCVLGRGTEEAHFLREKGIKVELVPGITSAIAAAEAAEIPLTHRGISSSFHVLTGHDPDRIDFNLLVQLVQGEGTLIFMMAFRNLETILNGLQRAGLRAQYPAAFVQQGTTAAQGAVIGCLDDLLEKIQQKQLKNPAVLVVGRVAKIGKELNGLIKQAPPLKGKRIFNPRPAAQKKLDSLIEQAGGESFHFPLLEFKGPLSEPGDQKLTENLQENLQEYSLLVFSSSRGVEYFLQYLHKEKIDLRCLNHFEIAALGPSAVNVLEEYHLYPDLIPEEYSGQGLVKMMSELEKRPPVLFPRSRKGKSSLITSLNKAGFSVTEWPIYDTIYPDLDLEAFISHIKERKIDYLLFTSPSTVESLSRIITPGEDYPGNIPAVCIGPVTADRAQKLGYNVQAAAEKHTAEGIFNTLLCLVQPD